MSFNGRIAFWVKENIGPTISDVQISHQFLQSIKAHQPDDDTRIQLYLQINDPAYIDPPAGASTQFRDDLHRFLSLAQKPPYKMRVHAFGGRPNWIDTDATGAYVEAETLANAVLNFNAATLKPTEQFKALHLDVEPHGCFNGLCSVDFAEGNNEVIWANFLGMFQRVLNIVGDLNVFADVPPWYYNSQVKNGVTAVDIEKVSVAPTATPLGDPVGYRLNELQGPTGKRVRIVLMSYRNTVDPATSSDGTLSRGIVGFSEQAIDYLNSKKKGWWLAVETQPVGGDVQTPKVTYGADNKTSEDLTDDINELHNRYALGGTEMDGITQGGLKGVAIHYWASFVQLPTGVPQTT